MRVVRSALFFVGAVAALAAGVALARTSASGNEIAPVSSLVREAGPSPTRPPPPSVLAAPATPPAPVPAASTIAMPVVPPPARDAFSARHSDGMAIWGSTPHRMILFTFDDGPDRGNTPRLLQHLDRLGIRAVFFLSAGRMRGDNKQQRDQADIARDIIRRGHLVGNHTIEHPHLTALGEESLFREIAGADDIFERQLGDRPRLFRPPFGVISPRVEELLSARGYTVVFWNLGTGDWLMHTPEEVLATFRRVYERREREDGDRGGIVLLHDTHRWSVDAVPLIVDYLLQRNCELYARGEELFEIVDDIDLFYVPRGEARVGEVAPPLTLPPEVLAARQARVREITQARCNSYLRPRSH